MTSVHYQLYEMLIDWNQLPFSCVDLCGCRGMTYMKVLPLDYAGAVQAFEIDQGAVIGSSCALTS